MNPSTVVSGVEKPAHGPVRHNGCQAGDLPGLRPVDNGPQAGAVPGIRPVLMPISAMISARCKEVN